MIEIIMWRLVYDGDCGFCLRWVNYFREQTRDLVRYTPYQEVSQQFKDIPIQKFKASVYLFYQSDGVTTQTYQGAEVFFRILNLIDRKNWLWCYEHIPFFKQVAQWGYQHVATHRPIWDTLVTLFIGKEIHPLKYHGVTLLFTRSLGAIYLMAFGSLFTQIIPLIGSDGLLPT